jgi:hypothetical protein
MVNPLSPIEYVTTNARVDPDGNGRGTTLEGGGNSTGFQQLENGGLRIVRDIGFTSKDYFQFCVYSTNGLANSLLLLGSDSKDLQGKWQSFLPNLYPATQAKLFSIDFEKQIYESSSVIDPGVLSQ